MHGLVLGLPVTTLTVDTSSLTTAIQDFMTGLFPWVAIAIAIIGPVMAIGIGFKFGRQILGLLAGALGLGGK